MDRTLDRLSSHPRFDIPAGDGCNVCTCAKGALSCTARPCRAPTACGARAGDTCAGTEYCAYTPGLYCGAADAESVCKPRPTACSTLYQPVCGCDGKTYPNACGASLAGNGVLQTGPCAGSGQSCIVGNTTYPDGTGNIPAPDGCNTCGCRARALSCTKQACTTPKMCGGITGRLCAATEYCAYTTGQSCGANDASSTCQPRAGVCPDIVDPVCGCDQKVYPNADLAGRAGVGYLNKGACIGTDATSSAVDTGSREWGAEARVFLMVTWRAQPSQPSASRLEKGCVWENRAVKPLESRPRQ